jgi:hypothetical protein
VCERRWPSRGRCSAATPTFRLTAERSSAWAQSRGRRRRSRQTPSRRAAAEGGTSRWDLISGALHAQIEDKLELSTVPLGDRRGGQLACRAIALDPEFRPRQHDVATTLHARPFQEFSEDVASDCIDMFAAAERADA